MTTCFFSCFSNCLWMEFLQLCCNGYGTWCSKV